MHGNAAPLSARRGHEPRWLDRQLSERLPLFFGHSARRQPGDARGCPSAELADALRIWQWERLCATLRAAAKGSLHYRGILGGGKAESLISQTCGGASADARRVANQAGAEQARLAQMWTHRLLSLLPFTYPDALASASESFLAVPHDEVEGVISLPTSGTTGKAKRIYCTPGDLALTADFFRHGMQFMVRPGRTDGQPDHVVLLMSGDRPGSVGDLLSRGMRELGVSCEVAGFVPPGDAGEAAMMARLRELRPTCLVGVPAQIFSLSRHAGARSLDLRGVLLSGDAVTKALRSGIESGFGCPVFVHYGLTECGLGGAVECDERCGSHMREADLIHEIVDRGGRELPPGSWGEIVITTLTREAMPLLRYRTGDEGRVIAGPCACGSVLSRIELRGRLSRRIDLPGGGALRGIALDEALFALPGLRGYAATVYRDVGDRPLGLLVDVYPVPGANAQRLAADARIVLGALPELGDFPVTVRIVAAGSGEESRITQAKMRFAERRGSFPF